MEVIALATVIANPKGYPVVCEPEACDCKLLGYQAPGVHIILGPVDSRLVVDTAALAARLGNPGPRGSERSLIPCHILGAGDHNNVVHVPGSCRCRVQDGFNRRGR